MEHCLAIYEHFLKSPTTTRLLSVSICVDDQCWPGLDRFIHVYLSVAWLFEWGLRHVHLKPALDRSRLKDSGQTRSLANAPHFHISEVSSQNKREIKTLVVLRLDRGRKMSISSQAWTDSAGGLTVHASWTTTLLSMHQWLHVVCSFQHR